MSNWIKCPKCGREYHPAEIFMPREFFGQPKNICKNEQGHIEYFGGTDMDTTEKYICDCGTPLIIEAKVSFNAKVDQSRIFEEETVTDLYKDRIKLVEND